MPAPKKAKQPESHGEPLAVELWPIARPVPYAKNARTVNARSVDAVAASLKEFGWRQPIVCDEKDVIIAGHKRLLGAQKLGLTHVPVHVAAGLTPAQVKAYRLMDNRSNQNSEWDLELLQAEMAELVGKIELELTGFEQIEIAKMLADSLAGDPDEIPPPAPEPISRTGDRWLCGAHVVLCGDATSPEAVARLLGGAKPDMVLTDPPYCSGGFQEAGKAAGGVGTRGAEMIANDTLSTRGYMALLRAVLHNVRGGIVYIFTDWRMWINLFDVVESSGFGVRNMIVWDKGSAGMGQGWRMQHELIMCGVRVKNPFNPKKAQGNVIQAKRTGNHLHATEKPVDLLVRVIEVTDQAKTICDPFCGSGSVMIAAHQTGRVFYGMELMPGYADVSVMRWQTFTGQRATLDGDGRTFDEIKTARSAKKEAKHAH